MKANQQAAQKHVELQLQRQTHATYLLGVARTALSEVLATNRIYN
jgi:hypothetical protein